MQVLPRDIFVNCIAGFLEKPDFLALRQTSKHLNAEVSHTTQYSILVKQYQIYTEYPNPLNPKKLQLLSKSQRLSKINSHPLAESEEYETCIVDYTLGDLFHFGITATKHLYTSIILESYPEPNDYLHVKVNSDVMFKYTYADLILHYPKIHCFIPVPYFNWLKIEGKIKDQKIKLQRREYMYDDWMKITGGTVTLILHSNPKVWGIPKYIVIENDQPIYSLTFMRMKSSDTDINVRFTNKELNNMWKTVSSHNNKRPKNFALVSFGFDTYFSGDIMYLQINDEAMRECTVKNTQVHNLNFLNQTDGCMCIMITRY